MNIFERLRADHDTQRQLIGELVETQGASPERVLLFQMLRAELSAHAGAEERHFYVPLMKADLTQEKARHSVAEHKELDDLVERLDRYDPSGSAWLPAAQALRRKLEHHLEEEEREVFPLAGKALSEVQKSSLAADYDDDMSRRRPAG